MTTIVPGPKIPRSPGTTWENLGCPKDIPRVLGQLGISRDVLPDMTTKVPGPKDPKKSWDNLGDPGMSYHT